VDEMQEITTGPKHKDRTLLLLILCVCLFLSVVGNIILAAFFIGVPRPKTVSLDITNMSDGEFDNYKTLVLYRLKATRMVIVKEHLSYKYECLMSPEEGWSRAMEFVERVRKDNKPISKLEFDCMNSYDQFAITVFAPELVETYSEK